MKVLLVNGSPHKEGCTYTALCEVSKALNDNGVDTDIFWIGNKECKASILLALYFFNNFISTQPLTVLTMRCITSIVRGKQ